MQTSYTTRRLLLNVLNENSAEHILNFLNAGRDIFSKTESVKPDNFYTLNYQTGVVRAEYDYFLKGKYIRYYISLPENPTRIIGTVSFGNILPYPYNSCILGYKFLSDFQHRGYAFESTGRLIDAMFEENRIHRMEAFCLPGNRTSAALLERLHFRCEGVAESVLCISGEYCDHLRYALINPGVQLFNSVYQYPN